MTEEERILRGELFASEEPELVEKKDRAHRLSQDYNRTYEEESQRRWEILTQLLGEIGEGTWMLGPIHFHYGCHTRVGKGCFMNFNFTVQDDAPVTIGEGCVIGAGSVVTHDIPPRTLAVGVPARAVRPITQADSVRLRFGQIH